MQILLFYNSLYTTGALDKMENEEFPFEVLSTEQIVQHMLDCIKEVNTIVEIPAMTTRILLNHFKWDKDKFIERYYDEDQEKLFLEAHVISPHQRGYLKVTTKKRSKNSTLLFAPSSNVDEICEICLSTIPNLMMTGLECGHTFCLKCWKEYLTTKIMDDCMGQTISCAAHNCDILVDDATIMHLITDQKVKLKYQHLITNSFVECNRLMQWCPGPDCNNAIRVQYAKAGRIICACGMVFCFGCGEHWHDPVKCKWLKKWKIKCDSDSKTSNWIVANTKECPKCHVIIEKNGGCNHMVCKNQNCKAHFCWVCLGSWLPHGFYFFKCNRYDEEESKAAPKTQQKSREALLRYLFYYNRYMNHMQSLHFEHKLYASIKVKMGEMQKMTMSWIEVQFLKTSVDVLCQCRQTLMYTYVFAYYLERNNQCAIFEDNQKNLENATENLSEYLERDMTSENFTDIKQKVQDMYKYCERRRRVLVEHVFEGYQEDWWKFIE